MINTVRKSKNVIASRKNIWNLIAIINTSNMKLNQDWFDKAATAYTPEFIKHKFLRIAWQ